MNGEVVTSKGALWLPQLCSFGVILSASIFYFLINLIIKSSKILQYICKIEEIHP